MKTAIFVLSVSLALGARAQDTMTLARCIEEGLRNNPALHVAGLEAEISAVGVKEQQMRRSPTIGGVFQMTGYIDRPASVTSGSLLGTGFPDDPTWQAVRTMRYNAGAALQLNLPLLDLTVKAGIDVAKLAVDIRQADYERRREGLIVQIANVYYLAQATQEQLRLTEANLHRMTELVDIARAKYDEGVALETDFTRSEVNRKQLETLRDAYATALRQQKNLMKSLLNTDRELDFVALPDGLKPSSYHGGLYAALPEIRLVDKQSELVARQMAQVRRGYWPTIALQGQLGVVGYQEKFKHFFHTDGEPHNWYGNTFLGLSVRIPIFDANAKKLKIRQAKLSLEQLKWQRTQTMNQLDKEYADVMLDLTHNLEAYRTQQEACRQAEDIYRQAAEQYAEGLASMTELLQDEMALRTSQTQCVQAVYAYKSAELKALKLSGELDKLYKNEDL